MFGDWGNHESSYSVPSLLRLRETNVAQVSELFVNHDSEDPHHGPPAVVDLDGPLRSLPLVSLLVPPKIDETVPVVARKVGRSRLVFHDKGQEPDRRQRLMQQHYSSG